MTAWKVQNGCYRIEASVADDGHASIATLCDALRVAGHSVALTPEQAAQLCRFLCNHVPGVAEAVLGKLVEM